jgi:Peptidase family C25
MTLIRTTLLFGALLARADAADPVWVPLDGSPPGTPAQILFDAPASGLEDCWFDIFIHGFWREDIQPGDGFTYQRIEVPGLGHITQLGAPDMPVARVRVAVPTSATKVTLASVTDLDPRAFGGMLPYPWVLPALDEAFDPGANPGPGDPDGAPSQFVKDGAIYGGVNSFPAGPGTLSATVRTMLGGLRGAVSAVFPASWNPGTGVLAISAHLRVHLQMVGVPQPSPGLTKDRAALAGATFLNWADMGPWFPVNTSVFNGRFLVVAAKHRLVTLEPLIDHRKARGFSVEVLQLESLPVASCDAIRTGIATWLGAGGAATDHYVLLVGDSSEIPLCPSPGGVSDDRYGSPVDGDADPEVWVGRLSVDDNADLARQIKKVIAYAGDQSSHHDEALLVAHAQGAPGGYQAQQEAVAAAPYADAPAFKKVYGATLGVDALDVRAAIDAGTGLVAYRGHGTQATWADWNLPAHDFHKNQVLALTNPDLPVVWSFSCWNSDLGFAPLGTQDSLGETWLEHPSGAVAHYGATAQVSTVENDALERALFRGLYDRGLTRHAQLVAFGEQQITDTLAGPGSWAGLLLGDPAQRVRRKDPVPLFLEMPAVVPVCAGPNCNIAVRVTTTGGVPVVGALVALHKRGPPGEPDDILVNGYTGTAGMVIFPVGPADLTAVIDTTGSDPDGNEATGQIGVSDGVWANFGSATPGIKGDAVLLADGPMSPLSAVKLDVVNAAESAQAGLFVSLGSTPVPFQGGTLLANPWIVLLPLLTDPQGELHLAGAWPSGVPSDLEFWFQLAISDAAATGGVALSNAMRGTTP